MGSVTAMPQRFFPKSMANSRPTTQSYEKFPILPMFVAIGGVLLKPYCVLQRFSLKEVSTDLK
jgi:hypothetical protein